MRKDVEEYVWTCKQCLRNKPGSKLQGLMQTIPVPSACWEVVTTDFLTQLPPSNGCDAIQVVVCKLSKRVIYIPTRKNVDEKETAKLVFVHCVQQYGIPNVIISDRDPKFISQFWSELMSLLGVKIAMTIAH